MINNTLDIVVPVFNEVKNINLLIGEIEKKLSKNFASVRLIIVDDGSIDETQLEIDRISDNSIQIKLQYIKLTRNFGKEIAVKCGIDHSTSDYCAIMDGDLQHPPEYIIEAFNKIIESETHIVFILPQHRNLKLLKKIGVFGYRKILSTFSKGKVYLTDYTLMDRKAINLVKMYHESDFYTRGILSIIGLKSTYFYYQSQERKFGKTKFSFRKLINLAVDGIISVSTKPLRIAIYVGSLVSLFSILFGIYLLLEKFITGQPIPGFATLGFGMFFLGGIQLLFLGIIGEYIGKTFIQSKNRPVYTIDIIKEK